MTRRPSWFAVLVLGSAALTQAADRARPVAPAGPAVIAKTTAVAKSAAPAGWLAPAPATLLAPATSSEPGKTPVPCFDRGPRTDVAPGQPSLIEPSGTLDTNDLTYYWTTPSGGATWYYLWIQEGATVVYTQWHEVNVDVTCAGGTCYVDPDYPLEDGSYTWWIQGWNADGYGPWSDPGTFTVAVSSAPDSPSLYGPGNSPGSSELYYVDDTTPQYSWYKSYNATWYRLVIEKAGVPVHDEWYHVGRTKELNCSSYYTCEFTPPAPLSNGEYNWMVQAWNEAGYSSFSSTYVIHVDVAGNGAPPQGDPYYPSSCCYSCGQQEFGWQHSDAATWYYLWIQEGSTVVYTHWYEDGVDLFCFDDPNGTCGVVPGLFLPIGDYTWWVQTWSPQGYGEWSDPLTFSVTGC